MSVLVTGGHGFVGMHVVYELINSGKKVVVNDISETTPSLLVSSKDKYIVDQGDITDLDYLFGMIERHQIEGIIHLAAIKNEQQCRKNPVQAFNTNLGATINMFEVVRKKELKRMITLSSAVVFSEWENSEVPVKVTDPPSPVGLYSTLKHSVEEFARVYRTIYKTPIVTVRISRAYGPGVLAPNIPKESNPIPQLLWDVIKHKEINQESGADFEADFSYVKDVARGIVLSYTNEELPSPIIHIGGGKLLQVREVVKEIQVMYPDLPVYVGPSTEPYSLQAPIRGPLDTRVAKKELGYEPQYTLKEGLKEYIDWIKNEVGS